MPKPYSSSTDFIHTDGLSFPGELSTFVRLLRQTIVCLVCPYLCTDELRIARTRFSELDSSSSDLFVALSTSVVIGHSE